MSNAESSVATIGGRGSCKRVSPAELITILGTIDVGRADRVVRIVQAFESSKANGSGNAKGDCHFARIAG